VKGATLETTPKTATSQRLGPWTPTSSRSFAPGAASKRRIACWRRREGTDYVFADGLGRPLHPDTFTDRFRALVREAGLRPNRLHDTRHTACSLILAAAVPAKVVSELTGDASPSIAMAIYQHVTLSTGHRAGEQLSASLFSRDADKRLTSTLRSARHQPFASR